MRPTYRPLGLALGLVALLIPIVVVVANASGVLRIRDPHTPRQPGETPPLVVPFDVPEQAVTYAAHDAGESVTHADGRRLAQLPAAPSDMQAVSVYRPDQVQGDSGRISFTFLGDVRYKNARNYLQVTTIRPSDLAAQQILLLGDDTVRLSDGTAAWTTAGVRGGGSSRVAFTRDGLIIAVSGDLPLEQLLTFASAVTLVP